MLLHRSRVPWTIAIATLVLVVGILILGYQSFIASERAAFDEFNQRQLLLARAATAGNELYFENLAGNMRLVVGLSILTVLLGAGFAVLVSLRMAKYLEKEVKAKTAELEESHAELRNVLGDARTAHAFQQSIIDGVGESIMVIDTEYHVKLMNRAAREFSLTDVRSPEAPLCYQLSHRRETPCDGEKHPCPLQRVRQAGRPVTVVHEHYRGDGERRFVELLASPLWGADGEFRGIIESTRDVTERIRARAKLQQNADRLRALTLQLAEVAEAERQRLARELHDQVGQNLTALGINLNLIRSQMTDQPSSVGSRLDDSLVLVEQTSERIRDVMADLRPPVLDDYGLVAALRWYGEQVAQRTKMAVTVEGEEPNPRLARRVENALFRIAQEALTNVAKHARATRVTVATEMSNEVVRLIVADDGIGFDPARLVESDGERGWGLLTMSERAEAVGAQFRLDSALGRGTHVAVEVER